jgi:hypothetical protein
MRYKPGNFNSAHGACRIGLWCVQFGGGGSVKGMQNAVRGRIRNLVGSPRDYPGQIQKTYRARVRLDTKKTGEEDKCMGGLFFSDHPSPSIVCSVLQ